MDHVLHKPKRKEESKSFSETESVPTCSNGEGSEICEREAVELLQRQGLTDTLLSRILLYSRKLLLEGDVVQFLWVMYTMHKKGWIQTLDDCGEEAETVAGFVAKHGTVEDALKALDHLPLSHKCFHLVLEYYGKRRNWSAVLRTLKKLQNHPSLKPNKHTLRYTISASSNCGRSRFARKIFRSMVNDGIRPDVYTYNALLHAVGDQLHEVEELFTTMTAHCDPDRVTFDTVLNACARNGDPDCALKYLYLMEDAGFPAEIDSYNSVFRALFHQRRVEEAFDLREEMMGKGVRADLKTWSVFIRGCGRAGHIEKSFTLWEELLDSGAKPNAHCFNSLMSACLDGNGCPQPERALGVFEQLMMSPIQVPVVSFNIAIKAAGHLKDVDRVRALLEQLQESQCSPNQLTWSTVMDAYADVQDACSAQEAFQQMVRSGIRPDAVTYTTLIKALVSSGRVMEADEIYKKMCMGMPDQLPRRTTYNTLIRGFRESGDVDRAMKLYQKMREQGFSPNNAEFRALLDSTADAACSISIEERESSVVGTFDQIEWSFLLPPAAHGKQESRTKGRREGCVDLHGLSTIEARAAVLCILRALLKLSESGRVVQGDLVIITGAGNRRFSTLGSTEELDPKGDPPLRSAVMKLLKEELRLEIENNVGSTHENKTKLDEGDVRARTNPGRIVIRKEALEDWLLQKKKKKTMS